MTLSKLLSFIFILITILFIGKMVIEFLNCFHFQEVLYGGVPTMTETSYKYYVEENRELINKIVNLTHWGMAYGILSLTYWIIKIKLRKTI